MAQSRYAVPYNYSYNIILLLFS